MIATMRRLLAPALGVLLGGALLAGCSGPAKLDGCPKLDPPPEGFTELALAKDGESYPDGIECEWRAGEAVKVTALIRQPSSYDEDQSRADRAIESSWAKDDEHYVTRRVEGLGDGGYRFTSILNDLVTVVVKGFHGFRVLTLEVSWQYTSEEDLARREKASEIRLGRSSSCRSPRHRVAR